MATLFGEVVDQSCESDLHIPVNPLYEWVLYDIREDTVAEQANVPGQDQLQSMIDVSIRYGVDGDCVPITYQQFGDIQKLVDKPLRPA